MKNYTLKISVSLLLIFAFAFSNAQAANTAPAKGNPEGFYEQQVRKANSITTRIGATVSITDEQKTKLQASMLEALVNYNEALAKAKKEDESRLGSLNQELVTDITARIKAILTPEQFSIVQSKELKQ